MEQMKYYLQHYATSKNPDNHAAQVQTNSSSNLDAMIKYIRRRGTTGTALDGKAALDLFFRVLVEQLFDDLASNLPLANFRPSIHGTFKPADDSFNTSRHHCRAIVSQGSLMGKLMRECRVIKVDHSKRMPIIRQFRDIVSNKVNREITPGGMGQITGDALKFNLKNAEEGVFFVHADGEETRVSMFANHTEKKLIFSIPKDLAAGQHNLICVCKDSRNCSAK